MRFSFKPAALVLLCALLTACGAAQADPTPEPKFASSTEPAGPDLTSPREVLRDWDARRAAAWAEGDVDALAKLYVTGSRAGARDVALLQEWVERGARVEGMETQMLELRVRRHTRERIVVWVLDRVRTTSPGVADEPTAHVLELRRAPGEQWQMAEVRPG